MQTDYDVIVVGAGGAGLTHALYAAEAGARTLLVDADRRVGGSTALSGGVVYAAGTSVQRAAGGECFAIFDEAARSGTQVKRVKGGETPPSPSLTPERLTVRIRPAVVGITGAGRHIDPDTAVLGMDGEPVGGASLTNAFTYGRRAGTAAARCALESLAA